MTGSAITEAMVDLLNEGVAGISVPDLENLARGLLVAKKTPGARQIGEMLMGMVKLNREYRLSIEIDPLVIGEHRN